MNLNQLYYFQTLAQYEHYTKASQKLFISQPSLTYAIKELEKELGVQLFIKNGRNIQLSDAGLLFLKSVNKSLEALNEGIESMHELSSHYEENVNISVIPTMVNPFLAPVIKELAIDYPQLKINFRSEKTLDIIQGVKDNKYDFGICSKIDDHQLKFLPIIYEELVLITPLNHPLAKIKKMTYQDIAKYPFITYQKEISIYHSIMKEFSKREISPHILYQLDDESSIASMVSLGFGVAIVANNETIKPFSNIEIIHIPMNPDARIVYLVYNPQQKLSSPAKKLIDYIVQNDIHL